MKVSSGSARNSWKRESEVNKSKKSKNKTKNKDKGRDSEGGDMWNFGSGSYGKDDMKSRIKEKPQKYKSSKEAEAYEHKWQLTKTIKPIDIEDDFGDLGLDSDEN